MFWIILAEIGLIILSYILAKRARSKFSPGEVQAPEVAAGTPIPVAFGKVKLEPILTEFSYVPHVWSDGGGGVLGYRYVVTYMGLLCWGPIRQWYDIIFDDRKLLSAQGEQLLFAVQFNDPNFYGHVSPPNVTAELHPAVSYGTVGSGSPYAEIFLPFLFGGRTVGGEGGIQRFYDDIPQFEPCLGRAPIGGSYHMFHGHDNTFTGSVEIDQPPIDDVRYFGGPPLDGMCAPVYTTSGTGRIRYPHYGYVYLQSVEIGVAPAIKKQEHVISVDVGGLMNSGDANPVGLLLQILIDQEWGLGISESLIDRVNFDNAAAELSLEDFGVSGVMREQRPAEDYIDEILRTIDAALYRHPETGKLAVKLIRADYGGLPTLDPSNVKELEWSRRDIADTINSISVAFIDRDRLWQRNVVTVQDHANAHATGGTRTQTFEFPFISNETDALRVAARELKSNTLPLGSGTLIATRDQWDSTPGDVLSLSWPLYGIDALPVRVVSVDYGSLDDGLIEVHVVEDLYGLPEVPFTVSTDPWDDPGAGTTVIPQVFATKSDDGEEGTATLSIVNDDSVTLVEFATQTGRGEKSVYESATGGPQYTSQTVTLSAGDFSFIYWRVTFTDANGNDQILTGTVTFGASVTGGDPTTNAVVIRDGAGFGFVFDQDGDQIVIRT